jgi:hypothetical protein
VRKEERRKKLWAVRTELALRTFWVVARARQD